MALETGTYVNDLVTTNPVGASDTKADGDDHLRLIKSVLKATFPNASRAFRFETAPAAKTSAYTVLATDERSLLLGDATTAAFTFTLPLGSTVFAGWWVGIMKSDSSANAITVDGNGTEKINGALTRALAEQYHMEVYEWDGAEWKVTALSGEALKVLLTTGTSGQFFQTKGAGAAPVWANALGLKSFQIFTTTGANTWTKPAGITEVLIELAGAGAAGGGTPATGAGNASSGAGGGAGGYLRKLLDVTAIASSTVTVGAGGTGVSAGNGNAGGNTSWADGTNTFTANGGAGGTAGTNGSTDDFRTGGGGGSATLGDVNITGEQGEYGVRIGASLLPSGRGGNSVLGSGGAAGSNGPGGGGGNYGGGGGGASASASQGARSGGAGGSGIAIIWEFG